MEISKAIKFLLIFVNFFQQKDSLFSGVLPDFPIYRVFEKGCFLTDEKRCPSQIYNVFWPVFHFIVELKSKVDLCVETSIMRVPTELFIKVRNPVFEKWCFWCSV